MLFSGGVKMYMDGSGGARTAWMHDDWNKNLNDVDTGNPGYPATPPDEYRTMATDFHNAGVHVSTHAIGDRAIDWVVDTYAQALAAKPTKGLRHGIIHANTPTDHAIDEMARLQRDYDAAFPEASAGFMWWIGDTYAGNFGPVRNLRMKPLATWQKKGVRWGGGSDFSVTPYAARYGLWASVARETLNGTYGKTPFGMDEAVDVRTALKSYTIWAAHTMFLDDRVGSIEVGKDADLAVWDRDPYTVPTAALKDMKAELTLVGGRVVHRGPAFPAPQAASERSVRRRQRDPPAEQRRRRRHPRGAAGAGIRSAVPIARRIAASPGLLSAVAARPAAAPTRGCRWWAGSIRGSSSRTGVKSLVSLVVGEQSDRRIVQALASRRQEYYDHAIHYRDGARGPQPRHDAAARRAVARLHLRHRRRLELRPTRWPTRRRSASLRVRDGRTATRDLPRGDVLVFGGDEVYPDAEPRGISAPARRRRTRRPSATTSRPNVRTSTPCPATTTGTTACRRSRGSSARTSAAGASPAGGRASAAATSC